MNLNLILNQYKLMEVLNLWENSNDYCKDEGIKLYVLPPRSPKMNCYVERTNETYRYEFWNVYEIPDTIEETRKLLRKFEYDYNFKRPHQSLNYLTPMEYYNKMIEKVC